MNNENNFDNLSLNSNKSIIALQDGIQLTNLNLKMEINPHEDFYTIDQVKKENLYNLLNSSNLLIFLDNKKLSSTKNCLLINKSLLNTRFPGCIFLPAEYIKNIEIYIRELNTIIEQKKSVGKKIYNNKQVCNSIYFDEGSIKKNLVYKKMEIMNKILFIPISKYQLKLTEYKIRGFCQIAEELGAKEINIKFEKITKLSEKQNINLETELNIFAGSLGLVSDKESSSDNKLSYKLKYPNVNTISLNENSIIKKINKKKFIISESIYNSTLELQYLVHSRCRHFIESYSTVFSVDDSNIIDKKLETRLKKYGINFGSNYSFRKSYSSNIKILTDVVFSTKKEYFNNLNGYSVSLDKIGFKCLLDSIKIDNLNLSKEELKRINTENFKENGVYKIINFINLYIEKIIKHQHESRYNFISEVMKKIKEYLTLNEYSEIISHYFNYDSQWIHFENFIDILSNKTHSYDKLGYLIIILDKDSNEHKLDNMIRFIQQTCIKNKIEDNFWSMLKPNKKELTLFLKNKLFTKYTFLVKFDWYSFNSLIKDIEKYNCNKITNDYEKEFNVILSNMNLGYSQYEYYEYMLPFIIRHTERKFYKTKSDTFFISTLKECLNYESFSNARISSLLELESYINTKLELILDIVHIVEDFNLYILNNNSAIPINDNFFYFLLSSNFTLKYSYFNKKLNIILTSFEEKSEHEKNSILREYIEKIFINSRESYKPNNQLFNQNLFVDSNFMSREAITQTRSFSKSVPVNNYKQETVLYNNNNPIKLNSTMPINNNFKTNYTEDSESSHYSSHTNCNKYVDNQNYKRSININLDSPKKLHSFENRFQNIKKSINNKDSIFLDTNITNNSIETINKNSFSEEYEKISSNYFLPSEFALNISNSDKHIIIKFLKNIFIYNDKININSMTTCLYSYNLIYKNYTLGIKKLEYDRYIKQFITNLINTILSESCYSLHICYTLQRKKEITDNILSKITNDYFNNKCTSFFSLLKCIKYELESININIHNNIFSTLGF